MQEQVGRLESGRYRRQLEGKREAQVEAGKREAQVSAEGQVPELDVLELQRMARPKQFTDIEVRDRRGVYG